MVTALRRLGVSEAVLDEAQRQARQTLRPLHEVLICEFGLADHIMARATAEALGLVYLRGPQIDIDKDQLTHQIEAGRGIGSLIPMRRKPGVPVWVIGFSAQSVDFLLRLTRQTLDRRYYPAIATRQNLVDAIGKACGPAIAIQATNELDRRAPLLSAARGALPWQSQCLIAGAIVTTAGLLFQPMLTVSLAGFGLSFIFAGHTLLRAFATALGLWRLASGRPFSALPRMALSDRALPRYTVLFPLHREANLLPQIRDVVTRLDYPRHKLDVVLLLEASDTATIQSARAMRWPSYVTIHPVADYGPKTKPKAMNAALQHATGDLIVVYDAEDRPDPGQLRLAAETFAALPDDVAVLQARLCFFNRHENWLAGQFAIEYAAHFGFLLPALEKLRLPIPLGGTSNHIRGLM